jgi:predicted SAM-dependent methyltransferase
MHMKIAEREGATGSMPYRCPAGHKLNLGCGPVQPDGWVNIDGSNRARLGSWLPRLDRLLTRLGVLSSTEFGPRVKVHNLFKPLPFKDNSVACIYAGEVWEHFEYPDVVRLTTDCFRVLAPAGILRVRVPDGVAFWKRYLERYDEIHSKPREQWDAACLRRDIGNYFADICTKKTLLGSMGHKHKWQFDEVQLIELFQSAGFVDVERMRYHESRIPDVHLVERAQFLIVEGVKPG